MQSIYDDIVTALTEHDFSIPNVVVREPYDESPKTYPLIVVHEIVNVPQSHGTVNGETRTTLAYQLDIQTTNVVDDSDEVLSRWQAGRALASEATDLLETEFKLTRKTITTLPVAADVLSTIWRGECVAESSGYTYRP